MKKKLAGIIDRMYFFALKGNVNASPALLRKWARELELAAKVNTGWTK